ncbi:MAG: TetR/AcrR family transcriptional regulator, partial [Actinomycetota bacterium]|nr:TetR/AcrR family transcriptional regulator [Actinomycetota bacterium]
MSAIPPPATEPVISPKPLRADARRNRELVLCAARECIGVAGVQAQIDEIAQRAGVGVGTVYRHFETKDALIEALADEYFAAVAAEASAALDLEDPWESFSSYIRRASELLAANRGLAQVAAEQPEVMKAAAERAAAELGFFDTMEEILRRAHAAG